MTPPHHEKGTAGAAYAARLQSLGGARWKRWLSAQAPYRWHIRQLDLGRALDVGCGIGRNLRHLRGGVGVDHNPTAIDVCRRQGLTAYPVKEFFTSPDARPGAFDSLLAAHLVEHLGEADARSVLAPYLPLVKGNGLVVFITPQERGFASDPTHMTFSDFEYLVRLCADLGLIVERRYSFPFPRFAGTLFTYNEFVVVARKP